MWICFGRLKSASRSLQKAQQVGLRRPALAATTAAATSSPHVWCGTPKHTASATAGCVEQHLVDLARRDLLAAAVDHLLEAPDQRQVAVRVEDALIAGAEPAALEERRGVGLGVVLVAGDDVGAPDADLAALAGGSSRALAVADADADVGARARPSPACARRAAADSTPSGAPPRSCRRPRAPARRTPPRGRASPAAAATRCTSG